MNDTQTRFLHYVVSMLMYVGALACALFNQATLAFLILGVGLALWLFVLALGDLDDAKRISALQFLIWGIFTSTLCMLYLGHSAQDIRPAPTPPGIGIGIIVFILCLGLSVLFWHQGDQDESIQKMEGQRHHLEGRITDLSKKLKELDTLLHGK